MSKGFRIGDWLGRFHYERPAWAGTSGPRVRGGARRALASLLVFDRNRTGLLVRKALALGTLAAALAWTASPLLFDRSGMVDFEVKAPAPTELGEKIHYHPLVLEFSSSAARLDLVGKAVEAGVTLNPPMKGAWAWASDTSLTFVPEQDWAPDQEYSVSLSPSLFLDKLKVAASQARFHTAAFDANVESFEYAIDPTDPGDRRLWATVAFTYAVDPEDLKGKVELVVQGGKTLGAGSAVPFDLTFDRYQGRAYLRSDRLPVPAERTSVQLVVHGGVKGRAGTVTTRTERRVLVDVPGKFDRTAYGAIEVQALRNDANEYQQILTVNLTGDGWPDKVAAGFKAWLLPEDRKGIPGYEDEKHHAWQAEEVDKKVLAQGTPLALEALPTEHDFASLVSFRYRAPSGRMIYYEAAGGIEAYGGYVIKDGLRGVGTVPEIPKSVSLMSKGSLLSLGGEKTISVVSNDLANLRFTLFRLFPDQVNHLVTQTGGPFDRPSFSYDFTEYDMSVVYQETRSLTQPYPGAAQYSSLDFSKYLGRTSDPAVRNGLFLLKASEYDPEHKADTDVWDRRLILVTDLGLLAKKSADGSYDVFVENLRSGGPKAGAQVEVLGRNGLPVFAALADAQGRAHVPNLAGFQNEKEPVVFTARTADDFSFLPLAARDRFVNFSRFDVGGLEGADDPERLSAFVFSDRGLYRPGDRLHAAFVVRSGDWNRSLEGLPLEAVVLDPRGLEVEKRLVKLPASAFAELSYTTLDTALTGTYQINLSLVKPDGDRELLGSTSVRVEEFEPDRLTVSSHLTQADGRVWLPFDKLTAEVGVMNLYGLAAAGNPVKGSIQLTPWNLSFPAYDGYVFHDATVHDKSYDEPLDAVTTDADGKAKFDLDLTKFAPATFQLTFQAEAQEKQGGRAVLTEVRALVSPLKFIVGYKADGKLDYITKGAPRKVDFLALDPMGKPTSAGDLTQALDEVRTVSVLAKQEDGSFRYQSVQKRVRLKEDKVALGAEGWGRTLDTSTPGDFELSLLSSDGTVRSKLAYTVVGKGNLTRALDRDAELQIKLDRESYDPGQTIQLQIRAPYTGSGLITIERDKVYASAWFTTDTTNSVQSIKVPEGLEGTAYLTVSFVRSLDSREIFTSPLSSGVEPFRVSLGRRNVGIKLGVPALAKPGEPLSIQYSADRPTKIVVYAVDEGILQLARYKTPQPLDFFFQKRALEVQTSQILDLLLPEFSLVRELSAMGGDDGGALGRRQNPFKRKTHEPVAYWSGILDADTTVRSVDYTVPSWFNGTVRVMAVAVAPQALGSAQTSAVVRSDFVVTPSLPTFVAPGDEFLMGVNVANVAEGLDTPQEVTVTLDTSSATTGRLTAVGAPSQKLTLAKNAEGTLWFRVKAGTGLGAAEVNLTARAGDRKSRVTESLSIRPAVPYQASLTSGVQRNGEVKVDLPRTLVPEFRTLSLSLSLQPAALSPGLLAYLKDYPYGCTEQVVSQGFPLVALASDARSGISRGQAEERFQAVLAILRSRQNEDGSIGLWGGNEDISLFADAYAAHFLIEAGNQGYSGGTSVRDHLLDNLEARLKDLDGEPAGLAYALYDLARAGRTVAGPTADLKAKFERDVPGWKDSLAALFLAGTYSVVQKQADAEALLNRFPLKPSQTADEWFDSDLGRQAVLVYVTARHGSRGTLEASGPVLDTLVKELAAGRYSTFSSSFALLAFQAYSNRVPTLSSANLQVFEQRAGGKEVKVSFTAADSLSLPLSDQATGLRIVNSSGYPLYYQALQAGFDAAVPTKPLLQGLEVVREYQDAAGKALTQVKRGQDVTVVVRVRSLTGQPVPDLAVTDLVPGGFEVSLDTQANQSFGELVTGSLALTSAEAREDRVIVIGEAGTSATEFRYKIKALTAGRYLAPPVTAESMYHPQVRGQTAVGTLVVTE